MSIDAVINRVVKRGNDLFLDLRPRENGGIAGQPSLTILDFKHIPVINQEIWGGSNTCIIEPSHGIEEAKQYKRTMYTRLREI